jgi:two-component system heavy metal sensor histidine kinase CusS
MTLRLSSFRARIFLVFLLVVAVILAIVGSLSWTRAMSFEVDRLDARLCDETRRFMSQPLQAGGLERLVDDAYLKLRLQSPDQVLLWLQPDSAEPSVRSAHWPAGLDPVTFLWSPVPDARPEAARGDRVPPPGRPPGDRPPRPDKEAERPPRTLCQGAGFTAGASDWRAVQIITPDSKGLVAADLATTRTELRTVLTSIAWGTAPLALLLTALGAWLMSALAMRPVARLRGTLESVNQQSLDHRLPTDREDREFTDLTNAYNHMLERLEVSFRQATRFSADAAHELRTPLTILQGQIEQAMRLSGDQPIQVHLSQMLDEAGRLSSITRKLLLLSQADAGQLALLRTPVNLSHMLEERLADAHLLELPDVQIFSELSVNLVVQGDAQLLAQAFNNLCGNAFKYTAPGGWISVSAQHHALGVEVLWTNSTQAITPQVRARFFDRFFRGDVAHNRGVDGHGLGLSLSRVIAQAHGGDLTLEPSPADEVRLRLWLPDA